MKKMTEYIVAGVKADDEQVFLKRVAELMERHNLLEQLTEGIVLNAKVVDEKKAMATLSQKNKSHNITEILGCEVDSDNRIRLKYRYTREAWFKTEEDAKKAADGWGVYTSDREKDEYHVQGKLASTSSDVFDRTEADKYGVDYELL